MISPTTWKRRCARAVGTAVLASFALPPALAQPIVPAADPPPERTVALVGTTGPVAIRAGVDAMRRGGTAADAALTTALAQTVLAGGSWVSFAGRLTMVYYEAQTGRVYAINACYDAPRHELDPMSIPAQPEPSGRTVLVPGFMAGVGSIHERLGSLPFDELFDPAITLAEDGFVLDQNMGNLIRNRAGVLSRLPETRAIFFKESGEPYGAGDLFRQPELAATLRSVAHHGADYMYTGPWAERFVETVRREGGAITLDDLALYEVRWEQPLRTTFRGHEICGMPPPNRAGTTAAHAFALLERADFRTREPIVASGTSLYDFVKVSRASGAMASPRGRARIAELLPDVDSSVGGMFEDATVDAVWEYVRAKDAEPMPGADGHTSEHSDAIVCIDPFGNVAAMIHTINTGGWGTTGIFVDGVSIPDSAANQQRGVLDAGPGGRIADHGPPTVVLLDGRPVMAGSATGSGNVHANWQSLFHMIEFAMTPQDAVDAPKVYGSTVQTGDFDASVIEEARGLELPFQTVGQFSWSQVGFWVGLRIDPDTGVVETGKVRALDGIADGY